MLHDAGLEAGDQLSAILVDLTSNRGAGVHLPDPASCSPSPPQKLVVRLRLGI